MLTSLLMFVDVGISKMALVFYRIPCKKNAMSSDSIRAGEHREP